MCSEFPDSTNVQQKNHSSSLSSILSSETLILNQFSSSKLEESNFSSVQSDVKSHCNQHPTILKRTQKSKFLGQFSPSPIKTLTFSPSRFLNIHKCNGFNTSSRCKENSLCNAEDSGIELFDCDTTALFPSFTSTPRAQSNRNIFQNSLSTSPLHHRPATAGGERNDTHTPVIRKFLEESVLQTPTPFKCSEERDNKAENLVLSELKYEDKLLLVGGPMVPCCRARKSTSKMETKARKLVRNSTCDLKNKTLLWPSVLKAGNAQSKFLKPSRPQVRCSRKLPFADSYDHSSLTERTAVVEKRRITPIKSIYFTRRRKHEEPILCRQWVDVACGSSSDQKDMIAAAKRCLYRL